MQLSDVLQKAAPRLHRLHPPRRLRAFELDVADVLLLYLLLMVLAG
jgi:hypothetical protein